MYVNAIVKLFLRSYIKKLKDQKPRFETYYGILKSEEGKINLYPMDVRVPPTVKEKKYMPEQKQHPAPAKSFFFASMIKTSLNGEDSVPKIFSIILFWY